MSCNCTLQLGDDSPDVEAAALAAAFETTQALLRQRKISAGHDISDGGIVVGLLEMAFGGNTGIKVLLPECRPLGPKLVLLQLSSGQGPVASLSAWHVTNRIQAAAVFKQLILLGH